MRLRKSISAAAAVGGLLVAPTAMSHVSVQGPAFAGERQVLHFGIGHGCAGADTFQLEIHLPSEVTAVRAMPGAFGDAEVITNLDGIPTSVRWTKADVKDADDQYYRFGLRIEVPPTPFTTLYFPSTQVCRDAEANETTVEWDALPGDEGEPAPSLVVLPARAPGWNKYQVPNKLEDLESYFGDAQIVWAGDAAYSSNEAIMQLIEDEPGVTVLSEINAGTEIWVKY